MSLKVVFTLCRAPNVSRRSTVKGGFGLLNRQLPVFLTNTNCIMSTSQGHFEQKTSVDNQQVQHLASFADNWWSPTGFFKPLHAMNSLRIPLIRDGLIATQKTDPSFRETAFPLQGTKILDLGCGGGILSEPLARLGAQVKGIDASSQLIEVAKNHAQLDPKLKDNLSYEKITAEEHVLDHKEYYDAVVASEVIEHVHDHDFFVKKCVELIKPGGSIFITTMSKTQIGWLGGVVAAEYILGLVPKGTHDWDLFITPEQLQKIFEKYGCQTKLIHGMFYLPVLNKWIWTPNVCINYAIQAVKTPA